MDTAKKFVLDLLKLMVDRGGSDLFLTVGFPPALKIDGVLNPVTKNPLQQAQLRDLCGAIMNSKQLMEYETTMESNFAVSYPEAGRFRVNAFVQQGNYGLVFRTIQTNIPTFEQLGIPETLRGIVMEKRGLIIVVGATGSGKSSTLASMIGHRNHASKGHIITVEDPVEFVHTHGNCLVTQREVGVDTEDWHAALKNTLRQAPDVILIGEIRDAETMEHAVAFAETGHLCLATLHANNSNQAIERIINFFPDERRNQTLLDLSLNMRAFISQRLIPKKGGGRVPAVEIMLNTPFVSECIKENKVSEIKEAMAKSKDLGMQTFDQALFDLYMDGKVELDHALKNADSQNDLRLRIKLSAKSAELESGGFDNLTLQG